MKKFGIWPQIHAFDIKWEVFLTELNFRQNMLFEEKVIPSLKLKDKQKFCFTFFLKFMGDS